MQTSTPAASATAHHSSNAPLSVTHSHATQRTLTPGVVRPQRRSNSRISNIDSLLKIADAPRNADLPRMSKPQARPALGALDALDATGAMDALPFEGEWNQGVFLGLRSALLLNASVGIFAMLAYEAWSALAR